MADATKLEIGPANVYLYEAAAYVNIGYIDESLTIRVASSMAELHGSQEGKTVIDRVLNGLSECEIEFGLLEISNLNISRIMPNATVVPPVVGPPAYVERVEFKSMAGLSHRSIAVRLQIRPLVGGVESGPEKFWTAGVAAPEGNFEISYGNDNQRVLQTKFYCYPDTAFGGRALVYGGYNLA